MAPVTSRPSLHSTVYILLTTTVNKMLQVKKYIVVHDLGGHYLTPGQIIKFN